jgi:RNA polymerase sigma-70 factor, ECF subfamily
MIGLLPAKKPRATDHMEKPGSIASSRPRESRSVIDRNSTTDLMLASVPALRAFAISLCGNVDRADDLVQAALLQALSHIDSFQPGSMIAWLITILRNIYRSEHRKRRREVRDSDGSYAATLTSQPDQTSGLEFREFLAALGTLPPDRREALILVGASGLSYEEAAEICGCATGTIKSRVHRARARLCELLPLRGEQAGIRQRSQLRHAEDDRAFGQDIASKCEGVHEEARSAYRGAGTPMVARKLPPNMCTPPPRRWRPIISAGTSAP